MKSNYKIYNLDNVKENGLNTIDTDYNYTDKLNKINKIIYNIDQYSNGYNFGLNYENINNNSGILNGGNKNETITITLNKYKKIKAFAKVAKNTILKYKNVAQYYFDSYNIILFNYINLLKLLYRQKKALEDKITEYEKLSKNYTNGKDKINLLETMINGIEKVVAKTTNLDIDIKNKINGKEYNINANAKLISGMNPLIDKSIMVGGVPANLYGGMTYSDFETAIENDILDLDKVASEMEEDNTFITHKILILHDKVKGIIGDAEELFNIRLSIEWLVNQLEKKQPDAEILKEDYQVLYNKLTESIGKVKDKQKSPEIAEYLRKLEGMAKELETFIISSKDTLNSMSDEKRNEMLNTLRTIHGVNENYLEPQIGGNKINRLIGAGQFQNTYREFNLNLSYKLSNKITELNELEDNSGGRVKIIKENNLIFEIINKDTSLDFDLLNDNVIQDELYQVIEMSNELNLLFNEVIKYINIYNSLEINTLNDYNKAEDEFINIQWNNIFSKNITTCSK